MSMRTDAIETIKDEQWYAYSDITKDKSGSEEHSCIADAVFLGGLNLHRYCNQILHVKFVVI